MTTLAWTCDRARMRGMDARGASLEQCRPGAVPPFGFVPAGVRKRYYENTEDAIVMWCHDIQGEAYAERLRSIAMEPGGAP